MKNCNKIKQTCSGENYAECISYEGNINPASSLISNSCITIEETTQDIYNQLSTITTEGLGELCLTYTMESGKLLVKNVLKKFEEKICELEDKVTQLENREICDMPVGDCFNLDCLTDACNNTITTYGELIQALITKTCNP